MSRSEPLWDVLVKGERKSLSITVRPDKSVLVRAPENCSDDQIQERVFRRRRWIKRQKEFFAKFEPRVSDRRYISGETHLYLGRQYRLKVVCSEETGVALKSGYLEVHTNSSDPRAVEALLWQWYGERARQVFPTILARTLATHAGLFKVEPKLKIATLRKRWGSCHHDGSISLNLDLIRAPKSCIEYVLFHELCHLIEPNHSTRFYALLERGMPDWLTRKNRLEQLLAGPMDKAGG